MTIMITGATGNLGGAALRFLTDQRPTDALAVLVRDARAARAFEERGITARVGDYSDRTSLDRAFSDVQRLLFISSPVLDPTVRSAQHSAVVEASAGVEHVVYTSAMGATHDPGHTAAEHALAELGRSHTILRNALYSEPFGARALAEAAAGEIRSASAGRALATASIRDLAEAAVRALVDPPSRRLWELRGPAWTFDELAVAVGDRLGRVIAHREVDDVETGEFAMLFPLVRRDVFATSTDDLREMLGRDPRSIADVVNDVER